MNDRPDATELLEIARRTLLDDVLPRLPGDLRYRALMIANAMAIAAREHAAGDTDASAELARLLEFYGEPRPTLAGSALRAALSGYNQRLAADIRAGRCDGWIGLRDHLAQTTTDKLAIANPKALDN
ncbi:MAG: DUF6285 domain-containing protein [Pseudomonadota bacterium]